MFAIAGAFWFGLAFTRVLPAGRQGWAWGAAMGVQAAALVGLLWAGIRLRRRAEVRHILARFIGTTLVQALLIVLAVLWCARTHSVDRVWAWIGLVVSLHLVPLARIFHVRAYYVTAGAGTVVSILALARGPRPDAVPMLGVGLAAVLWLSAVYLLANADRIAESAVRETWAG